MNIRLMCSVGVSLLLFANAGNVMATAPGASATNAPIPVEAEAAGPAAELERGMGKMLAFLRQEQRPDPKALEAFLVQEIAPFFDFAYMAKSAAGPMYRHMSDEQREHMTEIIEQRFLTTMAQRLGGYNSQRLKVMSQRLGRDGYTDFFQSGPKRLLHHWLLLLRHNQNPLCRSPVP